MSTKNRDIPKIRLTLFADVSSTKLTAFDLPKLLNTSGVVVLVILVLPVILVTVATVVAVLLATVVLETVAGVRVVPVVMGINKFCFKVVSFSFLSEYWLDKALRAEDIVGA